MRLTRKGRVLAIRFKKRLFFAALDGFIGKRQDLSDLIWLRDHARRAAFGSVYIAAAQPPPIPTVAEAQEAAKVKK